MSLKRIENEQELEELLSRPTEYVLDSIRACPGDTIVLGAGGKMGPTLVKMLKRACAAIGDERRVMAVSRFTKTGLQRELEELQVETFAGNLLDDRFVASLPEAANVISMTGMKFGTKGQAATTWAMNTHLPSLVCKKYAASRILAFSTGNVFPLVDHQGPWSREQDETGPVGEYAMSALGRERMFEYFCQQHNAPTILVRLNYAVEMRYGVLVDIAKQVLSQQPINLSMGYANVIWQGDANAMSLASLALAEVPTAFINVAGPELICVEEVAQRFAKLFELPVSFTGEPQVTALLNDASQSHSRFGKPKVTAEEMVLCIADWLKRKQPTLSKPTQFQVRSGKF